ncbi:MAG: hypothetical protein KF678_08540 [Phycisphaeraceae bacterium]|nr:hypothetical protein [Phycisphaeraceae bacterium]
MKRWTLINALMLAAGTTAHAQLRIATWNVSSYNGTGRAADFQTAIYGVFQGRSMAPDVIICQEFTSASAWTTFRNLLNSASGSPGDWLAAPWVDGPDTDTVCYYRSGKLQFLGHTIVATGGAAPAQPRHTMRYDFRPVGYTSAGATFALYGTHMKAGSDQNTDWPRRLVEAQAIRADATALPAGWHFLLGGDFNMQRSTEPAYVELVGSQANNAGQFFDPIKTPGTAGTGNWSSVQSMRFVHTQAPAGVVSTSGGMDDRFDQILVSSSLVDGQGFDYIGNPNIAYSTSTWNDPNHSYRAWGNDGTSYNQNITITGNAMVGPDIAQALFNAANSDTFGGHLPVFLDLRVPGKVASVTSINFGQVLQNSSEQRTLTVSNGGNTALWTTAGIATLTYSLSASSGFTAPGGTFSALPGAAGNNHTITMNTSALGTLNGTVTITSNDPDTPIRIITLSGEVIPAACYANCDQSTGAPLLTANDFQCFLNKFAAGDTYANCDQSTGSPLLTANDFQCFLNKFAQGCG